MYSFQGILSPILAHQEEKQERFSRWFLCRWMLGSSQLNPSCRCDVQPPRKQLAHYHSALCFHDCSQAHTVYVSGAYVTQYNGRGWAYYFFFPLFVLWAKRNRGLDVSTASQFPCPRSCAQIYRVKILGWPPPRWRGVCQGIVSVWGNIHRDFWIIQSAC